MSTTRHPLLDARGSLYAEVALSDTLLVRRRCVGGDDAPLRAQVEYVALEPVDDQHSHRIRYPVRSQGGGAWWGVIGSHRAVTDATLDAARRRGYDAIQRAFPEVRVVRFEDCRGLFPAFALLITALPPDVLAQLEEARGRSLRVPVAYTALWERIAGIVHSQPPPEAP